MSSAALLARTAAALRAAGCVAAEEEATELVAATGGAGPELDSLVARRMTGEPLAWLTGKVRFCGVPLQVHPGVYVPRWQSEALARRAAEHLPERGLAVDLCTGAGAIAVALARARPQARVCGTEIDALAAACARANGVEVFEGDLDLPLPRAFAAGVDVVTGIVPYVPSEELRLLPRDVLAFEPRRALDGGREGTELLRRAVTAAARLLRPGGCLLLELGGDEADLLAPDLDRHGFSLGELLLDEEGDLRGIACRR